MKERKAELQAQFPYATLVGEDDRGLVVAEYYGYRYGRLDAVEALRAIVPERIFILPSGFSKSFSFLDERPNLHVTEWFYTPEISEILSTARELGIRITPGQISKGEPGELFQFHGYNVEGARELTLLARFTTARAQFMDWKNIVKEASQRYPLGNPGMLYYLKAGRDGILVDYPVRRTRGEGNYDTIVHITTVLRHGVGLNSAKSELFPLEFRDKQEAVLETHQELQTWKLSISRSWKTTFGDTGGV